MDSIYDAILFERGLRVGPSSPTGRWRLHDDSIFKQVFDAFGVRPIMMGALIPTSSGILVNRVMLDFTGGALYGGSFRSFLIEGKYARLNRTVKNIGYLAESVVYHCSHLALKYENIATTIQRSIGFVREGGSNLLIQYDGFYEFEALVTSVRRTFDSLRYVLWPIFGKKKESTPSNFIKALDGCIGIPIELKRSLANSWEAYGARLTEYRDCMQHYVPAHDASPLAYFEKLEDGLLAIRLRIPDNPEIRSQRKFTYNQDLDALTYGWQVANGVLLAAKQIVEMIPQ